MADGPVFAPTVLNLRGRHNCHSSRYYSVMKLLFPLALIMLLVGGVGIYRLSAYNRSLILKGEEAKKLRVQLEEAGVNLASTEKRINMLQEAISNRSNDLQMAQASMKAPPMVHSVELDIWSNHLPLGITADDLDLSTLRVSGDSRDGMVDVLFTEMPEKRREAIFASRKQPAVFGRVIGPNGFQLHTNGSVLKMVIAFSTKAEADTVATELRGENSQ